MIDANGGGDGAGGGSAAATATRPILRGLDLVRVYSDGNVQALRGVTLDVFPRESVAITGPSGCGKSTLLHLLGGLDRPDSGEVEFGGIPLAALDLDEYRALRVGFVFQSFHLLPTLSALENVQVPMFEADLPRAGRRARAEQLLAEVLELLGGLRRDRGLTLVIVTHSPEVAAAADRNIRLRDGRIVLP